MSRLNLSLTVVRISPSRFFPLHVSLFQAFGSSSDNPIPHIWSYGLASTRVLGCVQSNRCFNFSFCENWNKRQRIIYSLFPREYCSWCHDSMISLLCNLIHILIKVVLVGMGFKNIFVSWITDFIFRKINNNCLKSNR